MVPGVVGQLGEERPLGASVALAEWVQGINTGERFREPDDEVISVQASQPVRCCQATKDIGGVRRQMLWQAKDRPLGERNCA
jgi:hypothetical protein